MSMSLGAAKRRSSEIDMTVGPIFGNIFRFSVPLLFGNLFQMLYNMVDTWVVGNYVSTAAFSAVGTMGFAASYMP